MKNLYQCEKCGKLFDNWDDAYKCEQTHASPMLMDSGDLPSDSEFDECLVHYAEGESIPDIITLRFHEYASDGNFLEDEDGVNVFRIVQYAPIAKQNRALLGNLNNEAHVRDVERKKANDEWIANYYKEQAEKKRKAEEEEARKAEEANGATESNEEED